MDFLCSAVKATEEEALPCNRCLLENKKQQQQQQKHGRDIYLLCCEEKFHVNDDDCQLVNCIHGKAILIVYT